MIGLSDAARVLSLKEVLMPVHTPKEQARPKPSTTPNTKAPSNSPPMSSFEKLGGISGRK